MQIPQVLQYKHNCKVCKTTQTANAGEICTKCLNKRQKQSKVGTK